MRLWVLSIFSTRWRGRADVPAPHSGTMHIQQHFEEHNKSVLHELIRVHPLATFVTSRNDEIVINHMPFVLSEHEGEYGLLTGHMPLANPAWKLFNGRTKAVAVFQGAARYISPNWYPSKLEHGKAVPTWNYAVVHAHGCPRLFDDPDRLMSHLNQLTDEQEAGRPSPWKVSDAPPEYTSRMIKRIVGIEIPIASLVGKWKVSQNRSVADRKAVVDGLTSQGDDASMAMAELVSRYTRDPG